MSFLDLSSHKNYKRRFFWPAAGHFGHKRSKVEGEKCISVVVVVIVTVMFILGEFNKVFRETSTEAFI